MDLKSERRTGQADQDGQGNPGEDRGKKQAKRLGGFISCVLGILLGLGGIVGALLTLTQDVSSGVLAIVLGVLGYSLGVRRLGAATVTDHSPAPATAISCARARLSPTTYE